jgi:GNAT superfamily N-acetyltransferase
VRGKVKESEMMENSYDGWVSVSIRMGALPVATASIDEMPDYWWVSRVFVKERHRRKGFGSQCLTRAVELVREKSSKVIIVAPGGYNIPYEQQRAFYARHGFTGGPEMRRED